ncbi:MAG: DDE-type integrase/transposase/recombinase [Bacteroides sp.]|nr:DDE-type integrase/transposase/recombinase [Bacteroides sp.]
MSKQAYYKHVDNVFSRLAHERFLLEYVHSIRELDPGLGGEKLWIIYKEYFGADHSLGCDAFLAVLKQYGLMLRKHKKGCRTTDSNHGLPVYPNLVEHLLLTRADQVWVSDITYILTDQGFCYLSIVRDAYTHEVVGWFVAPTLESIYTLEALKMACERLEEINANLIHHSDRGTQYASLLYTSHLKGLKIQISMTESGDPKDNAIAERINGILKTEF